MALLVYAIDLSSPRFISDPYLGVAEVLRDEADRLETKGVNTENGSERNHGTFKRNVGTFRLELDIELLGPNPAVMGAQLLRDVAAKVEGGREEGLVKIDSDVKVGEYSTTWGNFDMT